MELAVPIRGLAGISGWEPHFVGALDELEGAVAAQGRPARTVVNLQPPLTAWELGQRLRGLGLESPVVVLGSGGSESGAPALAGVQWLERPSGEGERAAALERVVSRLGRGGRGGGRSREPGGHGLGGESPGAGGVVAGAEGGGGGREGRAGSRQAAAW